MRSKTSGVTLIELMVGLAIAAILVTLAAPSFVRLVQSNTMSGSVNTFLGDLRFARSEAIRRSGWVVVCRADDPESATPTCASGSSTTAAQGWASGWVVFEDRDDDKDLDATKDRVLRVQPALASMDTIQDGTAAGTRKIVFTATGRLYEIATASAMEFGGASFDTPLQRVVCVSAGGRARIAGDGSASCGTDNQ